MKFRLIIYVTFIVLFFSACQENEYPAPKNIPSKDEMTDILYEIHLATAIANGHNIIRNQERINSYADSLYADILERYNITDSVLVASILYYSSQYQDYEKIYENVIEKIQLELTKENKIDSISQARIRIDLDIRNNQKRLIELMEKNKD